MLNVSVEELDVEEDIDESVPLTPHQHNGRLVQGVDECCFSPSDTYILRGNRIKHMF